MAGESVSPGALIGAIAAVVVAALGSITSVIVAFVNKRKIDDLHVVVDGRLTQLLDEKDRLLQVSKDASFKAGQKDEKDNPKS